MQDEYALLRDEYSSVFPSIGVIVILCSYHISLSIFSFKSFLQAKLFELERNWWKRMDQK